MIATCNACQSRFRVADDKVGPRGVKVRCSKCQTVFLVLPAPPAPAVDPFAGADPFAAADAAPRVDPFAAPPAPAAADPFAPRPPTSAPARAAPEADPFAALPPQPPPPPAPVRAAPEADPFAAPHPLDLQPPAGAAPADPFSAPEPLGLEAPEPRPAPASLEHAGATSLSDLLGPGSPESARPGSSAPFDADFSEGELGGQAPAAEVSGLELDLPALAAPPPPAPARAAPAAEPAARADAPAAAPAVSAGRAPAPPAEAAPAAPAQSRVRAVAINVLSLAALLGVAVGFFMFWRGEGRVDLGLLFQRDDATPVSAAGQPLIVAARVTNGVYETAHGKSLRFVRGEVQRHEGSGGPIKVKVALLDGERVAAEVEGLAGAVPTPEELYDIGSAADTEKLLGRIASRAPARASAGEWLSFLVPLADAPADRHLALRVRAETAR
ncbi:MAG TPA: zinc-ribbon domain-containing protein [Anaeromyxobacteraceae bacterium]|jgi:Meckel syndrome type 1 protein|nr:zinc-ribbon domain-containing protein [Anaeromyxobacteraceae bacterium]